MLAQRTLTNPIKASGVGLHSGRKITIKLLPAPENTGIIFQRVDCDPVVEIQASVENVGATALATTLVSEDIEISTVEHMLSAFAGLGIDNAYVQINDIEVPIMDGSANPFVFLIQSAGIKEQKEVKKFIKIKKPVSVEANNGARVSLSPYDGFKVSYELDYDHPVHKRQPNKATIDFNSTTFLKEISRARTFGFMNEVDALKKENLALGASEKNAIAIGEYEILNEEGLRSEDEFVKHKILDVIGDLYLLKHNLIGSFEGYKSGHSHNNQLLRKLIDNPDTWEIITAEEGNQFIRYIDPIIDPSTG